MAKWVHSSVLDNGLNAIKNGATKQMLIKAYAAGDSYATVTGNKVAEVNVASADFTLSSSGNNRVLTTAVKNGVATTAPTGATPDLHVAWTNGVDTVLFVTDETTDKVIASGDQVNFPAFTYQSNQPT